MTVTQQIIPNSISGDLAYSDNWPFSLCYSASLYFMCSECISLECIPGHLVIPALSCADPAICTWKRAPRKQLGLTGRLQGTDTFLTSLSVLFLFSNSCSNPFFALLEI